MIHGGSSYNENQKKAIYKYRQANKDIINKKLRDKYKNDEQYRESYKAKRREYYSQNKNKTYTDENKKIKSRLYSRKQYYKNKLLDILKHNVHVDRFDKYMLKLEQLMREMGYENIDLDVMFPDENIKEDDIKTFKTKHSKVVRDISYYSQKICKYYYIPDNVKQMFLFITYMCKKNCILSNHTPNSASQGILYFCFDYLNIPYVNSDFITVSITTLRKISNYLYSIQKDIVPSQFIKNTN